MLVCPQPHCNQLPINSIRKALECHDCAQRRHLQKIGSNVQEAQTFHILVIFHTSSASGRIATETALVWTRPAFSVTGTR